MFSLVIVGRCSGSIDWGGTSPFTMLVYLTKVGQHTTSNKWGFLGKPSGCISIVIGAPYPNLWGFKPRHLNCTPKYHSNCQRLDSHSPCPMCLSLKKTATKWVISSFSDIHMISSATWHCREFRMFFRFPSYTRCRWCSSCPLQRGRAIWPSLWRDKTPNRWDLTERCWRRFYHPVTLW